ncbi:MAG: response regulator [Desulfuromonadales bacterium]|nr:response regulator [Chloroflexota bacterium]MCK4622368.1 response regulator [Desulfuromonadales bacterium]OEU75351.1 MAG: two-component system response regulator [Desulfuromonadales bacterium C00003093]
MQKKVLIVEDEESLLKLESILLTTKGYLVQGVDNGLDALEAIDKEAPDLVLLDIMLPKMDGFEVCSRIKRNPATKHIPVILLTAKKTPEDLARGQEVGADHYITKPFKSATVMETIELLINKG